jgi:uncharacterized membrane protein
MASQQLVLAMFEDEAQADVAAKGVENWAKRTKRAKLSAVGVLVKDEKGKIKTHKLGHSRAGAGAVLFGLAAFLTGGLAIGLGMVGGALVGAGVGSLFHKGLKISKEEKERLNQELDDGKAALGVMVKEGEAGEVAAELVVLGGQVETYEVSEETMKEIQSVATDAASDAGEAAEDDSAEDES